MGTPYDRSIFAVELEKVLKLHGYSIHRLRSRPFLLEGKKIDRLEANLSSLGTIASLTHTDLARVLDFVRSTSREQRIRIYAALIALGSQRQLIDSGLTNQRAWEIAEEVCDAAYAWLLSHPSQEDLLRRLRLRRFGDDGETPAVTTDPTGGLLFTESLDDFYEGTALHALGIELSDRAHLEVAALCYARALRLLQALAPSIQATEEHQFWYAEVKAQHDLILDQLA